jgi:hypothetical protein
MSAPFLVFSVKSLSEPLIQELDNSEAKGKPAYLSSHSSFPFFHGAYG